MKYVSTRGHAASQSFTDILLEGLAPDGGLMVPEQWPRIMPVKFRAMRDLAYPQLAFEILRFFAADYPGAELKSAAFKTYTAEATVKFRDVTKKYPVTFDVVDSTADSIRIKGEATFSRLDFKVGKDSKDPKVAPVQPDLVIQLALTLKKT